MMKSIEDMNRTQSLLNALFGLEHKEVTLRELDEFSRKENKAIVFKRRLINNGIVSWSHRGKRA